MGDDHPKDDDAKAAAIAEAKAKAEKAKAAAVTAAAAAEAAIAAARKAEEEANEHERHAAELSRAQERAQLHAQAVAVQNVKAMVPFVLDQTSGNYSRWRTYFLNIMGKYDLLPLILSDADFSADHHWLTMDCTVKSWLFGTVSPELVEVVSSGVPTSRSIWLGLENQFIGNKETRALLLDAEFHTLVQGDLTVTEFCRKLKNMADALADLGEPVPDRTLVLNVIRGLNDKYSHMAAIIQRQRPFPCFSDVRADLQVEESMMAKKSASMALSATTTQPPGASTSSAPRPSGPPANPAHSTGYGRGNTGRNYNRRRQQQSRPNSSSSGAPGWPQQAWNPYTGTFTMWAGPAPPQGRGSGVLGSQPTQAPAPRPQQALTASTTPVQHGAAQPGVTYQQTGASHSPYFPAPGGYYVPTPTAPAPVFVWDQNALAQSFNTMQLTPPSNQEFYMDSGASSHMASSSGSHNQERDRQVQ